MTNHVKTIGNSTQNHVKTIGKPFKELTFEVLNAIIGPKKYLKLNLPISK